MPLVSRQDRVRTNSSGHGPWGSRELAQLLARAGLGDRAAFATLYERTSAHLFAVILRINRDRAQAEDMLQEVYVNVWRSAQSFDAAQSQPLTWLTSMARNRAIDSLRRAQSQPQIQAAPTSGGDDARTPTCTTSWPTTARGRSSCSAGPRRRAR
jgi:DNA-directed RNA polymerase specialized sigma24 family protein